MKPVSGSRQRSRTLGVLLLALYTASSLTACGASSKRRDGGNDSVTATSVGAGAECGLFASTTGTLGAKITTYYSLGVLQEDHIRVRITSAPAELTQTQTGSLQFFRWSASSKDKANLDPSPLTFVVETPEGLTLSNPLTSLDLATIGQIRSYSGMTMGTAQDFFNKVVINVSGTDYSWHAIKATVYQDTKVVAQADGLLPIYAANPNTYAATHAPMLAYLHPFWSLRSQNLSDSEWISRSKTHCF